MCGGYCFICSNISPVLFGVLWGLQMWQFSIPWYNVKNPLTISTINLGISFCGKMQHHHMRWYSYIYLNNAEVRVTDGKKSGTLQCHRETHLARWCYILVQILRCSQTTQLMECPILNQILISFPDLYKPGLNKQIEPTNLDVTFCKTYGKKLFTGKKKPKIESPLQKLTPKCFRGRRRDWTHGIGGVRGCHTPIAPIVAWRMFKIPKFVNHCGLVQFLVSVSGL